MKKATMSLIKKTESPSSKKLNNLDGRRDSSCLSYTDKLVASNVPSIQLTTPKERKEWQVPFAWDELVNESNTNIFKNTEFR